MPPKKKKENIFRLSLSDDVESWLRREAELRGQSRSAYVAGLVEAFYQGRGFSLKKRAGTESEMCNLLYNNLQALYFFREHLDEKDKVEIVRFCRESSKVISLARAVIENRHAGIDKMELNGLLDTLNECISVIELLTPGGCSPELERRLKKLIFSGKGFIQTYKKEE